MLPTFNELENAADQVHSVIIFATSGNIDIGMYSAILSGE